jgi:hypothetical protein
VGVRESERPRGWQAARAQVAGREQHGSTLAARHEQASVMTSRVACSSSTSATHGCVRAWARGGDWPEVREGLTYDVCMSMKRKQCDWVHGADKLGHERACARGSRVEAAPHGSVQVGHVCETRESGLTDEARLAAG